MKAKKILLPFTLFTMIMAAAFQAWNVSAEDIEALVLFLPFEEEGDPVDLSPDPTKAYIRGDVKHVDGKYGEALEFDGDPANYVEVDHAGKLVGMKAITIEAWAKPYGTINGGETIISKRTAKLDNEPYNLFLSGNKQMVGRIRGDHGNACISNTVFEIEIWYHVAYVFDGNEQGDERQKMYINGELDATHSHPDDSVFEGDAQIWIGLLDRGEDRAWEGIIDEVTIWNKALSADEIEASMEQLVILVESRGKLATTWGEMKNSL